MSFVLRLNGQKVAESAGWNPSLFRQHAGVKFQSQYDRNFTWSDERGYTLGWEDDPAPTQAQLDREFNIDIREQIDDIERRQDRAVREAILDGDHTRLAAINASIVALRQSLRK